MDPVLSAIVALGIAGFSAWVAYQLGLRQDATKWLRERRAEVYIDVLAEGYAEQQWALGELTYQEMLEIDHGLVDDDAEELAARSRRDADEWRQQHDRLLPDTRLDPVERARLGARMAAYASPEVTRLFSEIGRGVGLLRAEVSIVAKVRVQEAFDRLQKQVQHELRTPPGRLRTR